MKKLGLVFLIVPTLAFADLGIIDTASEAAAKSQAAGIGITQIYDHPNQPMNGTYVVPVQYNRTNAEGNGAESDPNNSKRNDIDYIPLTQLKGAKGDTGTAGVNGNTGATGSKGDQGIVGAKGETGDAGKDGRDGKDANVETRMGAGVVVKIAQERYFDVESFVDYDITYGKVDFFGMRVVVKPGKSYEQRKLEKQQKEIDNLRAELYSVKSKGGVQ